MNNSALVTPEWPFVGHKAEVQLDLKKKKKHIYNRLCYLLNCLYHPGKTSGKLTERSFCILATTAK